MNDFQLLRKPPENPFERFEFHGTQSREKRAGTIQGTIGDALNGVVRINFRIYLDFVFITKIQGLFAAAVPFN